MPIHIGINLSRLSLQTKIIMIDDILIIKESNFAWIANGHVVYKAWTTYKQHKTYNIWNSFNLSFCGRQQSTQQDVCVQPQAVWVAGAGRHEDS